MSSFSPALQPATPHATPDATPYATPPAAGDVDPLGDLLDRMTAAAQDGHAVKLYVYRVTPTGQELVREAGADWEPFSESPGVYFVRAKIAGKWAGSARVKLAGASLPAAANPSPAPTPAHGPAMDPVLSMMLANQQAQAQRQHELLLAIVTKPSAESIKLADVLPLIGKGQSSTAQVRDVLELARELGGGRDAGGDAGGGLGELAAALAPLLASALSSPAPQIQPRPALPRLPQTPQGPDGRTDGYGVARPAPQGVAAVARPGMPDASDTTESAAAPNVEGAQPDTLARVVQTLRTLHPLGVKPQAAANVIADILEAAPESDSIGWDAFASQIYTLREDSELSPPAFAIQAGMLVAGQFSPFVPELDRAWLDALGASLVEFAIDACDPEELRGLMAKAEQASIQQQQGNDRAKAAAQGEKPKGKRKAKEGGEA